MRIKIKSYKDNQTRLKKKFLFLPTRIEDELIFLESIIVVERYNVHSDVWVVEKSVPKHYDVRKLRASFFDSERDSEEDWLEV